MADEITRLIEQLNDPDGEKRIEAARALGELGDTRAVVGLMAALRDSNSTLQEAAAEALARLLPDPRFSETSFTSLIQDVLGPLGARLKARQITIEVSGLRDVPPIEADAPQLARAIQSVLENTIKYMADGGRIVIQVSQPDEDILITIETISQMIEIDDYSEAILKETPQQLEASSGLGFAQQVIAEHGGRMWVESGKSSRSLDTVHITLPLKPPDEAKRIPPFSAVGPISAASPADRGRDISFGSATGAEKEAKEDESDWANARGGGTSFTIEPAPAMPPAKLDDVLPQAQPSMPPMARPAGGAKRRGSGPHLSLPKPHLKKETTRQAAAPIVDEPPQFSAYYPATVGPKKSYVLMAFVHWEAVQEQVRQIAAGFKELMGGAQESGSATSRISVGLGSLITFVAAIPGITLDAAEKVVIWNPPYQSVTFSFTTPAELKAQIEGRILVYHGPLIVGEIPVKMAAAQTQGEPISKLDAGSSLERFDPVFASYSHKDTPVMEYFRRARANMGQKMLVDVYDLRSGEHWQPRLLDMIDECAVFQLFWSRHSAQSTYCRQEWEHALTCAADRGRFIQPVWWEAPMIPPPPELADLHFQRVTIPAGTRLQVSLARIRELFGRK